MTDHPAKLPIIQMIQTDHSAPLSLFAGDKVVDIQGTQRRRRIKNVTMNEPHFRGIFPGMPIMPWRHHRRSHGADAAVMVGVHARNWRTRTEKVYFMAMRQVQIPPQGHSRDVVRMAVDHPARQAGWQGLEVRRRRVGSR